MATPSLPPIGDPPYPPELADTLRRAAAGDKTVLPELKKAFDDHPELRAHLGDLAKYAEQSLIAAVAGVNLVGREAIARQADALRADLERDGASALEKLLIDRVVVCWVEVYFHDILLGEYRGDRHSPPQANQACERWLDRAHQRYLSAVRALTTCRKHLRPSGPGSRRPPAAKGGDG